jgi:tellurite resistance protein
MRNIESPILVFASRGDNITPPQQALNWIPRVYGSVEALRQAGQVIIYIIHENIGHLGIFVSGSVARKEHNEIIGHFDMIDYLPPGLYEMVIDGDVKTGDFVARFEERTMDDIAAMGDEIDDEKSFRVVNAVSKWNESLYGIFLRPWVKMWSTDFSGEIFRWMHPLRVQRYMISSMNPFLKPLKSAGSLARTNRKPVAPDNLFLAMEQNFSSYAKDVLNHYRDSRDRYQELLFQMVYDNDFVRALLLPADGSKGRQELPGQDESGAAPVKPLPAPEEGGFAEGLIRGIVAMIRSTPTISRRHYTLALDIAQTHRVLKKVKPNDFKRTLRAQARILENDEDRALKTMAVLIPNEADRLETVGLLRRIALADGVYSEQEKEMLEKISQALKIKKTFKAASPGIIADVN